jgi:hypothetical protein
MLSQRAQEPCLVEAGQGFSVLYKERFLYSKYSPDRAILKTVSQLEIPDDTLILALSPCLGYGLNELLKKLPENSFVLAVELEKPLYSLAKKSIDSIISNCPDYEKRITLCSEETIEQTVENLPCFKRCITIEMSGGTFFNSDFYDRIKNYLQNYTASFWKNRVTLLKLGRLFSRNFIKNLKLNPALHSIKKNSPYFNRPIIVFGAGESAEDFIKSSDRFLFERCTIIAVDAALPVLLKHGLDADFVVSVESQFAIEKAWLGSKTKAVLITDMAGRPSVIRRNKNGNLFFYSEYAKAQFFSQFEKASLLPQKLPPLGSVGLTAVFISLFMRKSDEVPVIFTGLDFSFSTGATHARGAPAHTASLLSTFRLKPPGNFNASFKPDSHTVNGIDKHVITDAALSRYAELFRDQFSDAKNLYDARTSGLPLGIKRISIDSIKAYLTENKIEPKSDGEYTSLLKNDLTQDTSAYTTSAGDIENALKKESESLLRIKELLSKGDNAVPAPSPDLETELSRLLEKREYLYLHFPDGYKCDVKNLSFLKRVRSEIDFFIKDLK